MTAKLIALGWLAPDGTTELSWRYWQERARFPVAFERGIEYLRLLARY